MLYLNAEKYHIPISIQKRARMLHLNAGSIAPQAMEESRLDYANYRELPLDLSLIYPVTHGDLSLSNQCGM
jgi:hypothetical protein